MGGRKVLDLSSGFKTCPGCKTKKTLSEFHKSKDTLHGYQVYCKPCQNMKLRKWLDKNPEKRQKNLDYAHKWRKENPGYQLDRSMMKYGLLQADYIRMLAAQKGICAICGTAEPKGRGKFHVDHCHEEGTVRGLLCHHCNLGLGNFKHRTDFLSSAAKYLAERRSES